MRVSGWLRLVMFLAVIGSRSELACADVIELKSGHRVEGDVLKEQGEVLYVDLGFEVLRVPISQVRSRTANASNGKAAVTEVAEHKLYREATLPRKTIRELAEQYGEGVVLLQTPS